MSEFFSHYPKIAYNITGEKEPTKLKIAIDIMNRTKIKTILEESNSCWENLIDITVFLTNMKNDFKKFNDIYNLYFPEANVCRTTVEVNALPTDIAIELKCIALINK